MKGILLLLGALFLLGCIQSNTMNSVPEKPLVCVGVHCLKVEVASTPGERAQGLMFRETLGEEEGMVFIFEQPARHGFWMRNTLIPLDIVWISEKQEVVEIQTVFPCEKDPCPVFSPDKDALYVLETNAGLMNKWNVKEGTVVSLAIPGI
jgi:uncharacterized membrane protein (UPF0127 family)